MAILLDRLRLAAGRPGQRKKGALSPKPGRRVMGGDREHLDPDQGARPPFASPGAFFYIAPMRLTNHTDYALRVLLFTAAAGETVTISRISSAFGISKEHLRKVVHTLAQLGYLHTTQGRYGGIALAMAPERINLREVVSQFEPTRIAECFDQETNTCPIDGMCALKRALYQAQKSFMDTLNEYHLSDLIKNPRLIAFCRQ